MLVSVIIVTYNQEKYIGRALEHALAQRCDFDWEIIVADDHSTDSTPEICRRYAEQYPERIRFIERERNVGVRNNYYAALHCARGRYVADQGGDDFWTDPCKLQKEADFLRANPGCVLVHTDWENYHEPDGSVSVSPSDKQTRWHQRLSEPGELFLPLLKREVPLPIHMCTAMYDRQVALDCYRDCPQVFSAQDIIFEDYQLALSLAAHGSIGWLDDITMRYSVGKPSLSSADSHHRQFRLYLSTLLVTRRLQLHHKVADAEMEQTYRELMALVYSQAFLSRRRDNIDMAQEVIASLPFEMPWKQRVMRVLTRCSGVWTLSRNLLALAHRV